MRDAHTTKGHGLRRGKGSVLSVSFLAFANELSPSSFFFETARRGVLECSSTLLPGHKEYIPVVRGLFLSIINRSHRDFWRLIKMRLCST